MPIAAGSRSPLSCSGPERRQSSYVFLRAFSLVMHMIVAVGAIIPDIEMRPSRSPKMNSEMWVIWKPAQFVVDVRGLLDALENITPPALCGASRAKVPDARSTVLLLAVALCSAIVAELRYLSKNVSDISHPVIAALFRGEAADVSSPMYRSLPKAMDSWFSVFDVATSRYNYELVVKHGPARRDQAVTPRYALSATVRMPEQGSAPAKRLALSTAARRIGPEILTFPAMLSSFVPELTRLGSKSSVILNEDELSRFVIESAPLLERLGVSVVLPKELKTLLKPRPVLAAKKRKGSGNLISFMDMASMLSFEWTVSIGDVAISVAEFKRMVKAGSALVRFHGDYLRLEASEAASILERIKKGPKPDAFDALQEYLAGETKFDETVERSLAALMRAAGPNADKDTKRRGAHNTTAKRRTAADDEMKRRIPLPAGLCATLQPYQERGFRWIASNFERGFGG